MTSQVDESREVVVEQAEKKVVEVNKQDPSKHKFLTTILSKRFRSHQPRTISQIIHHFPLMTSRRPANGDQDAIAYSHPRKKEKS